MRSKGGKIHVHNKTAVSALKSFKILSDWNIMFFYDLFMQK